MSKTRKGRSGWHQATLNTSTRTHNITKLVAYIKAAIVTLGLFGWLIRQGEPHDE